jgi:hypothetical protein
MCRPDRARSIIIIDDTENDASVVRTVLALMHGGEELPRIPIVAEIDDPATAEALRLGLDGRVTVVNPRTFVARTAAQACRSAGIALAYEDLLGFEGSELYLRAVPEAVGRSFGELLTAFPDACVVGHRRADGSCDLNPTMDAIVAADDELILLAVDDSAITFDRIGPSVLHEVDIVDERRPEHVVIFGWNPLCPVIIRELDGYVPPGSRITIAIDPVLSGGDGVDHAPDGLVNTEVMVRSATSVAYADLVQVIAEEDADHAIVLCYRNGLSIAEADAHALVTTLQVRRALETRGRDTTVVTELLDQRDVALAPPNAAGDFIVSDRLVSLLLTQLAENDHLAAVFDDLLDPAGAELYSRPATRYCEPGVPTTFGAIVAEAGRRGESAIGYRRMGESRDVARRFGATFNPRSAETIVLDAADQVIVLADHS